MYSFSKGIVLFLLWFSGNAIAQQYQIRNYSVKDGVGQSQVFALCQDQRGYIWMGTRGGGLTRFDGLEFRHYTTRDGLASNYIHNIQCDAAGDLWIATNSGLSKFNGSKFTNFTIAGTAAEILDFEMVDDANIYVASMAGLYRFNGSQFSNISNEKGQVYTVAADKTGNLWYGTNHNVIRYQLKTGKKDVFLSGKYINTIYCDAADQIWVGTYGSGIYTGAKGKFKPFAVGRNTGMKEVYEIYQDKKGFVWIGTLDHGIFRYDTLGKALINITEKDGLSNNHVRSILCDQEGNYWFGTSGGGVCHYFGLPFTHYDRQSGLEGNFIYSVFRDSHGRLWIGTGDFGVTILDSGKFKLIGQEEGFMHTKVKAIAEDKSGNIFLGTEGDGLFVVRVYARDSFAIQPLKSFRGKFIKALLMDKDGAIWAATAGFGLYRIEQGEKNTENFIVENISTAEGLIHNRLSALVLSQSNDVFYATESEGVGIVHNGSNVKAIAQEPVLSNVTIRCMVLDLQGYLWVGTAGDGVFRLHAKDGKLMVEPVKINTWLTSLNIYLLAFDPKGNLFVGSESGLDYLELNKKREPIGKRHFGKAEGFVGIETCQNAVCSDGSGNLWFGTINGLTLCNPGAFTKNPFPPVTGIASVRLFYKDLGQTKFAHFAGAWGKVEFLELPHNQNHLTFDLRGISLSNPEQVAFRWMLKGFDAQWSPESNQKSVTYSNIPPGDYVFMVKARNGDGVWNNVPQTMRITIHPPFWQTWWFIALFVAITGGFVWLVFRLRLNALRKRAFMAQEQLRLDKKVSDLEHQALRLQMNPHFIFNALNSIQSQIGEQNEQKARYYLAKFGRLMRQILDNSRKPFITLKEETETLENYLLVEKFSSGDTFDYEVIVNESLDLDFIKIPPMLLQPFVENAIKHGFKNLSERRGKIVVEFEEEGHLLWCTISDNGVGRALAQQRAESEGESYHESTALKVIRERLQLMHDAQTEPVIEIDDLTDEKNQAIGTKIRVAIPIF